MGTRRIRREDGEFTLFFRKVSPFSNHHPADFVCDEAINCVSEPREYSCTEQYYMFNKAALLRDENLMTAVLESDSPRAMKAMCSKGALRGWNDALWDQHKEHVMYTGCLAKFVSCQHLRFCLFLSTGSRLLECSPFDTIWGIGKDLETAMEAKELNTGKNLLGCILERVREELWNEELYRDEREEIERRVREDPNYLLKAMEQVDLLYKQRAIQRFQMSRKGRSSFYIPSESITPDIGNLFPEWALPPPLDENESIRPSPAQIHHFPRTPLRHSRAITPTLPGKGSRLFGRLTISGSGEPTSQKRNRSSSRDTFRSDRSRSAERNRKRRRRDSRSRRHRSRSRSPRNRRERREAARRSEERRERREAARRSEERRERRSKSHKKSHRHRSDSKEDREKRHSSRKSKSSRRSRSASEKHRRRLHRTPSSDSSDRRSRSRSQTRSRSPECIIEL